MDATLQLVSERGFDATPVTAIEAEAGLLPGNGSFYRHFSSKEEALTAAVHREVELVGASPRQRHDGLEGNNQDLARKFMEDLSLLQRMRPLILILARDRTRIPTVVRTIQETLVDAGLLGYSSLLGEPDDDEGSAIGAVVLTSLVGYHLSSAYFDGPPGGVGPERFTAALAGLVSGHAHSTDDQRG